jgi:hypothetical protein
MRHDLDITKLTEYKYKEKVIFNVIFQVKNKAGYVYYQGFESVSDNAVDAYIDALNKLKKHEVDLLKLSNIIYLETLNSRIKELSLHARD